MDYSPRERVQVKIEFLRLLTRMQLDPARMELITAFFDSYLVLNAEEEKSLQEKLSEELQPEEVQRIMELTTSWHLKGWQQGRQEGRQEILLRQLRKRLGTTSPEVEAKIKTLSAEQLDDLAEKILDITSEAELHRILAIKH